MKRIAFGIIIGWQLKKWWNVADFIYSNPMHPDVLVLMNKMEEAAPRCATIIRNYQAKLATMNL